MFTNNTSPFLVLGAPLLLLATLAGCTSESLSPTSTLNGDWQVRSLATGEDVALSRLQGKTVFLNIWATWCPPCVAELPSIINLQKQFADDPNVVFLLVSMDKDASDVQAFLKEKGYDLPVYTPLAAPPVELQSEYIPATFIIDPKGVIRKKHVGGFEWDRKSVVDLIKDIAKPSPTAG